ncbi:LLM class oxidoreductase [Paraburkholderia sp. J67]|uniref:LLM class oxidoreductase n=1 Tax=Paraburkholderia sp. J67 TaxID=2805435 RepID=UPI002ABD5304|nr:LLM class oxidoreductase [Paraburkholderia sp. J67]
MNAPAIGPLPTELLSHPAYRRVFKPGRLTFGFIMPLEGYPTSPFPTLEGHARLAKIADEAGFSALWMRDVPFYDPGFGDTGQMLDPFVYLGFLAGQTSKIALGTAGIVATLRDPLVVAKQAVSVDHLTDGRLLLGLSTGDRPVEYPAFNLDYENRGDRYREAFELIRTVTETSFPTAQTEFYGTLRGDIDLVPKPVHGRMPMLVVGRARQEMNWIAGHSDAWLWHLSDFRQLPDLLATWRASHVDTWLRPYGYGAFFDLAENPNEPLRYTGNGLRAGRNALIALLAHQQSQGVSHVAFNLKPLRRPAADALAELAEYVLPQFPAE